MLSSLSSNYKGIDTERYSPIPLPTQYDHRPLMAALDCALHLRRLRALLIDVHNYSPKAPAFDNLPLIVCGAHEYKHEAYIVRAAKLLGFVLEIEGALEITMTGDKFLGLPGWATPQQLAVTG